ncbi:MAG: hypothetical protein N2Z62_02375 [Rhodobacteraceae bacterium]|nr:hypothetical protein [Paracoccaceae bacterium]
MRFLPASAAALAVLLPALPAPAPACETARHLGIRSAQARGPGPDSVILSVTAADPAGRPAAPGSAAQAARKRLVSIDGALVELDEAFIRGQIEAGTFIVVYPGTTIPWDPAGDRHPDYPPDWF